jgi:hypothetical protein
MRFTKKISKIPQKGSCGHFIKHMVGSIFVLCYMLLSSGFWPKPCFISDDHLSPTSPASLLVPPWSIKVERWAEKHHAVHTRPPLAHLSLAPLSQHHHVPEQLLITRIAPMTCPRSPSHGIVQPKHAQHHARTCQAGGDRALARARASRASTLPSSPCIPTTVTSTATLTSNA